MVPDVLHLIYRRPFEDISGLYQWIRENSRSSLVGQHSPDEADKVIHCHVSVVGFGKSLEALRKQINSRNLGGRGQYQTLTVTQKDKKPYDEDMLNIYILKGFKENLRSTTHDDAYVDDKVASWFPIPKEKPLINDIIETLQEAKKPKEKTHWQLIEEILKASYAVHDMWQEVIEQDFEGNVVKAQGLTFVGRRMLFHLMVKTLNANKVRTSRNELERFYVTLIRHDYHSKEDMCRSILTNVFRA